MAAFAPLALLVVAAALVRATPDYCAMDPAHTMCRYRGIGPNCGYGSVGGPLTEQEKKTILETHNYYRAIVATGAESRGSPGPQPAATDMQILEWDDELATIAQRWADQCTFEHDLSNDVQRFSVGQNLFQSEGGVPWSEAITSWYSEVKYFDNNLVDNFVFDNLTGHYTQLAWGNTRYIGCAKRTYPQRQRRYRRNASLPEKGDGVAEYIEKYENQEADENIRQARRIDYSWNSYNSNYNPEQLRYDKELNAYNKSLQQYYEKYKNVIQNKNDYQTQLRQYSDYLNQAQQLDDNSQTFQNKLNNFNSLQKKYETYRNIYDRQLYYVQKHKYKQATKKTYNPVINKFYDFTTSYPVIAGVEYEYYVCNYGPSGGYSNSRMYTRGVNKCPYYGLCSDPLTTEYYPAMELENDPILSVLYSNQGK